MEINHIIIGPILTEKSSSLSKDNVYAFEVNRNANKNHVAEALEKIYKVKVAEVRILLRAGKTRRVGRKMQYKQLPEKKIAYVKLKEGKIDLFPKA